MCKYVGEGVKVITDETRLNDASLTIALDNGCGVVLVVDGYKFGHGPAGTYECTELPGGSA